MAKKHKIFKKKTKVYRHPDFVIDCPKCNKAVLSGMLDRGTHICGFKLDKETLMKLQKARKEYVINCRKILNQFYIDMYKNESSCSEVFTGDKSIN